jgi:predicted TIM-barrel fold metal-dependent hydrolase
LDKKEEQFMAQGNPQRIVDAHIHWFRKDNPYKHDHGRDYLPDHYLEDAAGYNVIGVVHIEAHLGPERSGRRDAMGPEPRQ